MITSRDKENSFDKIQQPFMLKIKRKRSLWTRQENVPVNTIVMVEAEQRLMLI